MADQFIACPSCGKKIPLTRALRADIEASLKTEFRERERELQEKHERAIHLERARVEQAAAEKAHKEFALELAGLNDQVKEQEKQLQDARSMELSLRRRERELEKKHADLEVAVERTLASERAKLVSDARDRLAEEHRLKDAEKERQLADMRRQIEDLKRRAEQGSQQLQGEAGEGELESALRGAFPADDITPVAQGVRGADLHQIVVDSRGLRSGAILWECKNARHWSEGWIAKLKEDQRLLRADVAVLVTASLPKGCSRFTVVDGVMVTDFVCASTLAVIIRQHLIQLAHTRSAAVNKGEKLELLYRYLSGIEFRQRVEAIVDAFERMREDLDQERRAAERQWAKRSKQIEAVTFNISGMYGDLQGLVPTLPPIGRLELAAADEVLV